jgi:hypothetical protein
MPSASRRQHASGAELQLLTPNTALMSGGVQQLFASLLQVLVLPILQMPPPSSQPPPPSQRPNWSVGLFFAQTDPLVLFGGGPPDQPQQSLST